MEMIISFPGRGAGWTHLLADSQYPLTNPRRGAAKTRRQLPFSYFLASIGTCAGIYVLGFCKQRGLPTEGIHIIQRIHRNPASGMVETIDLEIQVPRILSGEILRVADPFSQPVRGEESPGASPGF